MTSRPNTSVLTTTAAFSRAGATLTEVLMAILIMSIGIVSVCALFPVSILSSIRATQLTNARILRDNVNELVRAYPDLVAPPVLPDIGNWRKEWEPYTLYDEGDYVIPILNKRALFPEPYFALRRVVAGQTLSTEPDWLSTAFLYTETQATSTPAEAVWRAHPIPHYVIDPHGYFRTNPGTPSKRFGYIDAAQGLGNTEELLPLRTPSPAAGPLLENEINAIKYFTSPDSWTVLLQEYPASVNGSTTVQFPASVDLTNLSTDPAYCRVIFTRPDSPEVAVRTPAGGTYGSTLVVDNPVPTEFTGMARVETFSPRYTYFLTVQNRGADSPPRLTCAIVFNRRLTTDAEYAYAANFGNAKFTSVSNVKNDSLQEDQVYISWNTGEPDPFLKVGAYLFDARAAVFYRIVAVKKSGITATITLNRPVEAKTYNNNANQTGLAIIMPGILHVYDID